jgi:RimK family alpha-L-glutamate ligase
MPATPNSDITDTPTIGVLGLHVSKETKAILNAAEELGYDTVWVRQENTTISVEDGDITFEPEADIIINRLLLSASTHPAEDLGLGQVFSALRPMLNTPQAMLRATHKFATAAVLAEEGLPVPDALLALANDRLNEGRGRFGDRAVYKTAIGTHGGGTWRVELDTPVNPQVGDRQAFLQEYLEQRSDRQRDVRVYVVGDKIVGAMYRDAPEGEWRTNVSLGAEVSDASDQLSGEAKAIAQSAAKAVELDYAGVDLISDGDDWYILEINPTAGFRGFFAATGISPAPYIVQLAAERIGASVDEDAVTALATTLDDSRPRCTPSAKVLSPAEPAVVGYIEEVVVSGTRGSQLVRAKSDTGADRTSIDSQLAADVGTGPIKDVVRVKSGNTQSGRSRPLVDVVVAVGGRQHTVTASVEDRSHMSYPLLLGRDILQHYHVDVTRRVDADEPDREE